MTAPPCLVSNDLAVPHGFFTRHGGVSANAYASLNGSLSGGDDPARVHENRRRVAARLDLPPAALLGLTQIHSARVIVVDQPWVAGQGPQADAMVCGKQGVGLVVITADCAPVLFADAAAGVVAAAHAGWRGAVAGVLEATVQAMRGRGATRITACVGPCIAQPSYQVGADLRDAVLAADAEAGHLFRPEAADRWRFDLAGLCLARLRRAGVVAHALGTDTCGDAARFFSHRRRTLNGEGAIGHQMSAIRL